MQNNQIDYIEFKANDLENIKAFYNKVFKWKFTDYESTYIAFEYSGIAGGFEKTDAKIANGVLVVL